MNVEAKSHSSHQSSKHFQGFQDQHYENIQAQKLQGLPEIFSGCNEFDNDRKIDSFVLPESFFWASLGYEVKYFHEDYEAAFSFDVTTTTPRWEGVPSLPTAGKPSSVTHPSGAVPSPERLSQKRLGNRVWWVLSILLNFRS